MMKKIKIPVDQISDWESFHRTFKEVLGFPDFYGANMNAWIDCMTYIDDPDDVMTRIHIEKGEILVLDLGECTDFASRCPVQYEAILHSTAFVNYRRMEQGEEPVLTLSFSNNEPLIKEKT